MTGLERNSDIVQVDVFVLLLKPFIFGHRFAASYAPLMNVSGLRLAILVQTDIA